METYNFEVSEPIDLDLVRELIGVSDMTDKAYLYSHLNYATLNLDVVMENTLTTTDEQILDDAMADLVRQSWVRKRRDEVNDLTDYIVENTYVDSTGVAYYLDMVHQMSYKAAHDERTHLTYPYTVKGIGSHYRTFTDKEGETGADEFHAWYLAAMGWVTYQIQSMWPVKDSIDAMSLQQLKDFVDPRV